MRTPTHLSAHLPRVATAPIRAATNTTTQPLDLARLVGPAGWARLPAAVQHRFRVNHGDACYSGQMDLQCSPVGRIFALLARVFGSPLVGHNAQGLPTQARVRQDAAGGMVWERHFGTGSAGAGLGEQVVRSTKALRPDGQLMERTRGGLSMALDVFECDGALVFQSRRYLWAIGPWLLPVPQWLSPGTCRVTHTDLGDHQFRFTLEMLHPRFGRTFHQTGVFADPDRSPAA